MPPPRRHLVPICCSSIVAPRASYFFLISHHIPTPTRRRWRAQLISRRCYLSAATVIQVAFLYKPVLASERRQYNPGCPLKHPARHIFHRLPSPDIFEKIFRAPFFRQPSSSVARVRIRSTSFTLRLHQSRTDQRSTSDLENGRVISPGLRLAAAHVLVSRHARPSLKHVSPSCIYSRLWTFIRT